MTLASRFSSTAMGIQSSVPLEDAQIMRVAPSIFAQEPHESRSSRYAYIPTIEVLNKLRSEGFQPFFACQTRTRKADRREHTKHMLRLRHVNQARGAEVNEIIVLNSHDGASSYQMLAGCFRFVCANGLIIGDTMCDVRVRHTGEVVDDVIEGAYEVLDNFQRVDEQREGMKALTLNEAEQRAFASAALAYRYGDEDGTPAPVTDTQLLQPRRHEDTDNDLWSTFNRVQENVLRGGLSGRNQRGRRTRTREVKGVDSNVKLNRALWVLAEEMRQIKA